MAGRYVMRRTAIGAAVSALVVVGGVRMIAPEPTGYDRADYFVGWPDTDRDCQNLRAELLIAASAEPVTFATTRDCRVVGGAWVDPYTGAPLTDAGQIDVDHIVPLAEAHRSGASAWPTVMRRGFALDRLNLDLTSASVNRSKGDRDPATWWPTVDGCHYGRRWLRVKAAYSLTLDVAEVRALVEHLRGCDG